jgi:UDP:flavonoid glycosyltransferase YjiC (YdhE family)
MFKAIIHHGGSGTTHSVARAGKPQLILPSLLDQFYFSKRVEMLSAGPAAPKIKSLNERKLEAKLLDLMGNDAYKKGSAALAQKIKAEDGVESLLAYIERVVNSFVGAA